MATKLNFLGGQVQLFDDNGAALAGGKVYFYEPGTSTPKDTYTTSDLDTANANPTILDSAGRATIWLNGDYKVTVDDSADVNVYTEDKINPAEATVFGNYNLVNNGSFEDDTDSDGTPDDWVLTEYTGSTNARVTDASTHGAASMKHVSTGNGGGNIITNNFFEVSETEDIQVLFDLKSSVVDVRNLVEVVWYDSAKSELSTTSVYDESAANPTSFSTKRQILTPVASARFAKLRLYGCHSSDATAGTTWFDNVIVRRMIAQPMTEGSGIASANTITLDEANQFNHLTGATEVQGANAVDGAGPYILVCDGAPNLKHNATSHILPGATDYQCAAGDLLFYWHEGSGNYKVTIHPGDGNHALPRGHKAGLTVSNNGTDADHDLDIAVGEVRDSTNTVSLILTSALTKQLDAAWASGNNAGGLSSSLSPAANTWYHIF